MVARQSIPTSTRALPREPDLIITISGPPKSGKSKAADLVLHGLLSSGATVLRGPEEDYPASNRALAERLGRAALKDKLIEIRTVTEGRCGRCGKL